MFANKRVFLWMLFFSFCNVSDIWRNSISASSFLPIALLFIGCCLLDSGAETGAGGSSSSASPAFALILLNVLPWPTLNLHLSHCIPEYLFIFPLLILILKCTYDIGCTDQVFSSWSLKSSWVRFPEFKWFWFSHLPQHLNSLAINVCGFLLWQDL